MIQRSPSVAVDQGRRALLAGLTAGRGQQQDRRPVPPEVAALAAGLLVDADVLVAEEVVVLGGHVLDLPGAPVASQRSWTMGWST